MELLKTQVQNSLQLRPDLVEKVSNDEELLKLIEELVTELVNHDFERLLLMLYRLDVSEQKVKQALTGVRWTSRKAEPAPVVKEELLDMSLDFGEVAEDIGNIDDMIEPDMKSIKTSLKELKKSCD